MTIQTQLDGLRIDGQRAAPLHQQISECIRKQIESGAIRAGARLPSSRALASQLSVSRATVELAYSNLAAQGFVNRRSAAGTSVLPVRKAPPKCVERPPSLALPGMASQAAQAPRLFQMGLPALDVFPRKLWSRLATRHARTLPQSRMVYQDSAGWLPLRRAVANHLAIGHGIACDESHVFIAAGFLGALSLAARTLLSPGDKVWIEDPGFPPARHALEVPRARLVPVRVDRHGMDIAAAIALAPDARLALVAPVAQFPMGCTLESARRAMLLDWAHRSQSWVLHDDYETHFITDTPTTSLQSAHSDRVLRLGSFSNVLFPGVRLGYLVVPTALVSQMERVSAMAPSPASLIDQLVAHDFIAEGHFARHVARLKRVHAERRAALSRALNEQLGHLGEVEEGAGMHLLLRLAASANDETLADAARSEGMAVNALSSMCIDATPGRGLLLGFANVPVQESTEAARRLRAALTAR